MNKAEIISHAKVQLELKLQKLQQELKQLQQSSNEETKSSMGDKYETGRAMVMQEQEKIADQIDLVNGQIRMLNSIQLTKVFEEVQFGALVTTQNGTYFLSISLGVVEVEKKQLFMISSNAPVAQAMLGLKPGESFVLNGKKIVVQSIS